MVEGDKQSLPPVYCCCTTCSWQSLPMEASMAPNTSLLRGCCNAIPANQQPPDVAQLEVLHLKQEAESAHSRRQSQHIAGGRVSTTKQQRCRVLRKDDKCVLLVWMLWMLN
jgi:hypothetical protein